MYCNSARGWAKSCRSNVPSSSGGISFKICRSESRVEPCSRGELRGAVRLLLLLPLPNEGGAHVVAVGEPTADEEEAALASGEAPESGGLSALEALLRGGGEASSVGWGGLPTEEPEWCGLRALCWGHSERRETDGAHCSTGSGGGERGEPNGREQLDELCFDELMLAHVYAIHWVNCTVLYCTVLCTLY